MKWFPRALYAVLGLMFLFMATTSNASAQDSSAPPPPDAVSSEGKALYNPIMVAPVQSKATPQGQPPLITKSTPQIVTKNVPVTTLTVPAKTVPTGQFTATTQQYTATTQCETGTCTNNLQTVALVGKGGGGFHPFKHHDKATYKAKEKYSGPNATLVTVAAPQTVATQQSYTANYTAKSGKRGLLKRAGSSVCSLGSGLCN